MTDVPTDVSESGEFVLAPREWRDVGYLMSIIDAAIDDGFDPDEDGPLLDEIRAQLKVAPAPVNETAKTEHVGGDGVRVTEAGDGWQPIETAPKDGTTTLMGKWHDGERYWMASGCIDGDQFWCDFTDADFTPFSHQNPTHWRPLPAPPALQSEQPK